MSNTMQPVRLFDRKFVANTLKNIRRCPKCRSKYSCRHDVRIKNSYLRSNRPFLLPCGHSMCENCVFQHHENLVCNTCLLPVEIPGDDLQRQQYPYFQVRDFFDTNFYLFGELSHLRFYGRGGPDNDIFGTATVAPSGRTESLVVKCVECEMTPALGNCRQCGAYYCKCCFDVIHKRSKILKTHSLLSLEKGEVARLPKARRCRRHHRSSDCYCQKCRLMCCVECIRVEHKDHGWSSLLEENNRVLDSLADVLEKIKSSHEIVAKAQKDVHAVGVQLKEYASKTLEDISGFFLQLHCFLQNEERRVIDEFRNASQQPQVTLHQTYTKLSDSQDALNLMRSHLECYQQKTPADVHLGSVVRTYNTQLQQLPCRVQISKLEANPFTFETKQDLRQKFAQWYSYSYNDPNIVVQIGPLHENLNDCQPDTGVSSYMDLDLEISLSSSFRRNANANENSDPDAASPSASGSEEEPDQQTANVSKSGWRRVEANDTSHASMNNNNNCLVYITHVESPEHFYVRTIDCTDRMRELSLKYADDTLTEQAAKSVKEGSYYMAYHVADQQWCRAVLEQILTGGLYKVFLVDSGLRLEVTKDRLAEIDEEHLAIPFAAKRCALHDVMPATGRHWDDAASNLLTEITRNKPVRLSVLEQSSDSTLKVDLIASQAERSVSVRDCFLYTGLAKERSRAHKKMSVPSAPASERLRKDSFQVGEMLRVVVKHIEGPQEFYVVKSHQLKARRKLWLELNSSSDTNKAQLQQVFLASLHMCCAVQIESAWHRACVEEVEQNGNIQVRLVDDGRREVAHWRQLFVLQKRFRRAREFAIKCALADIEPLQHNNYAYTAAAVSEFRQMAWQPLLLLAVCDAKHHPYKVALHATRKDVDIDVAATLVSNGHGLSTGDSAQADRRVQRNRKVMNRNRAEESRSSRCSSNSNRRRRPDGGARTKWSTAGRADRTAIKVTHVVSPDEFYVQLAAVCDDIRRFHEQIEKRHNANCGPPDSFNEMPFSGRRPWSVGDHCMVHVRSRRSTFSWDFAEDDADMSSSVLIDQYEWHRGVIVELTRETVSSESWFSVFLRDIGATMHSVKRSQLFDIDAQLDRVKNTVHRCHLACVEPFDLAWSEAATDCFRHFVTSFELLSLTVYGERAPVRNSFPVILWGGNTATSGTAVLNISKHLSINRILVKMGLALLVERFVLMRPCGKIEQTELPEGEISLREWLECVQSNLLLASEYLPEEEREKGRKFKREDQLVVSFHHNSICSAATERSSKRRARDHMSLYSLEQSALTDCLTEHDNKPDLAKSGTSPAAWLHFRVIKKTVFAGYPTCVDHDCNVYLHEADDRRILKKMRSQLMKIYGQTRAPGERTLSYTSGQACLARYDLDCHFYRAVVQRKVTDDDYVVQFMDYGNTELVKHFDLRRVVPFPKLAAFCAKLRLKGIEPKNGGSHHSTNVLDAINKLIVEKIVTVHVSPSERGDRTKSCSIRIGALDLAELLICKGYVDRSSRLGAPSAAWLHEECRSRTDEKDKSSVCHVQKTEEMSDENEMDFTDWDNGIDGTQSDEVDYEDNCLNQLFRRLDEDETDDNLFGHVVKTRNQISVRQHQQTLLPPSPPPKKRMFDRHDYTQIVNGMLTSDSSDGHEEHGAGRGEVRLAIGDGDDEDIIELEHTFASNYWHTLGEEDLCKEQPKHKPQHPQRATLAAEEQDSDSEFDHFHPNETSTVFSHFSGIERFKLPRLPAGIHRFHCSVVSVVTPVILQIFAHLPEFRYCEMELQRSIKHVLKTTLPLTQFEAGTICLACYSKDKRWYRALIRSFNPNAETVDVLYVDYLNSETVPTRKVKHCPVSLLVWPLRTFRVRLHGLQPNPRMRESDIRQAVHKVTRCRTLFAVVRKQANDNISLNMEEVVGVRRSANDINTDLMEISLYDSHDSTNPSTTVYECLIQDNYFSRV